MITIKTEMEIEKMREVCKIVALTHEEVKKNLKPGITTAELNKVAEDTMMAYGANPSCKGYPKGSPNPFPAGACISINNEVIHGIPGKRIIKNGDLVSIDIVADKYGYFGDATRSYVVGNVVGKANRLVQITEECFFEGIKMAKVGNRISDISRAIQEHAEKNGFSVVREFQGHGIGRNMHEDPGVPNYVSKGRGVKLESGMTLAIEPMINEGDFKVMEAKDGWTILTADGKLSAHYENTILITNKGVEVLTLI